MTAWAFRDLMLRGNDLSMSSWESSSIKSSESKFCRGRRRLGGDFCASAAASRTSRSSISVSAISICLTGAFERNTEETRGSCVVGAHGPLVGGGGFCVCVCVCVGLSFVGSLIAHNKKKGPPHSTAPEHNTHIAVQNTRLLVLAFGSSLV